MSAVHGTFTDTTDEELRYHPVIGDADHLITSESVVRVLLVGVQVPRSVDHWRMTTRVLQAAEPALASGLYWFREAEGVALLAVDGPSPPGSPSSTSWDAPDEHPLINAYGWLCEWWTDAAPVPTPEFEPGHDVVTVPDGQEAKVRGRLFVRGTWMYEIRVEGRTVNRAEDKLALPEIDDDPFS